MNPLMSEQERALRDRAREAAEQHVAPRSAAIDEDNAIPDSLREQLTQAGFASEGDLGLVGDVLVLEQFGRASGAVATWLGLRLALAPWSEVAGAVVRIPRQEAGVGGGPLHVSAELAAVSGAAYASALLVAVEGQGLFQVEPGPDLRVGSAVAGMGLRGCGAAPVSVVDLELAPGRRVGEADAVGRLVDRLRVVQGARSVGLAQAALEVALAEVARRRESGDPVDRLQSVQWMLADIATETEAARISTWNAAAVDEGRRRRAAVGCRVLAAEAAVNASRRTLQICGAAGAMRGMLAERLYRDAKMLEIDGDTSEQALRDLADVLLPDLAEA